MDKFDQNDCKRTLAFEEKDGAQWTQGTELSQAKIANLW